MKPFVAFATIETFNSILTYETQNLLCKSKTNLIKYIIIMISKLKEMLISHKEAISFDQNSQRTKSSLIKILSKNKIWWWKFWNVYKSKIKIWDKYREFAIKRFIDTRDDANKSILIHKRLKEISVPTWTTYRKIESDWSILMTLWNKDGSFVFSSNNGSLDASVLRKDKINKIDNLSEFYQSAYDIIKKVTENNMKLYFDAYMFKYKENELSMIVWDFDRIQEDQKENLSNIKSYNIREFCYALLHSSDYFVIHNDFFRWFAYFMINKQNSWDTFLSWLNLDCIYNDVWNQTIRGY